MFQSTMNTITFIFVLSAAFSVLSLSTGQVICSGTLSGTINDNVSIPTGSCILSATVTGSVSVSGGASLTTTGAATISGNVQAISSGDLTFSDTTTVFGSILSENSPSTTITVASGVVLGTVELKNSGSITVQGTVNNIWSEDSENINIDGGSIGGGGLQKKMGSGDISLCSATVNGSISILEVSSGSLTTINGCSASTTTGSILVEKSIIDVNLDDAQISSGDVKIIEVTGDVTLSSSLVSDISVSWLSGDLTLNSVTTDSDVEILQITGSISISSSTFTGDTNILDSEAVTLTGSTFANEDINVGGNSGPISISNNNDFSISITENNDVTFSGNTATIASFTKNTGGVSITDNTITELSCVDNSPTPTGAGNTVITALDQCSGF